MKVLLHNIRSVHNVASIARTSDCLGVAEIVLSGITPGPYDRFGMFRPQFVKVSLGAEQTVPFRRIDDVLIEIEALKRAGYSIYAVEQADKAGPYFDIQKHEFNFEKCVLIFGSETGGLPDEIMAAANKILEIPMRGLLVSQSRHPKNWKKGAGFGKESLNVAIAFAIVAAHMRWLGDID